MNTDAFVRGFIETALWSSSIEDFPERRIAALREEIAGAYRLGRDPQRQLCALADLEEDTPAPDVSMQSWGFTADDLAEQTLSSLREECEDFIEPNRADLEAYCEQMGEWRGSDSVRGADARYSADEQAGGDFWLTKNRHGAGFWDRGLGELGERLADAARVYGTTTLYVGDDERIYA